MGKKKIERRPAGERYWPSPLSYSLNEIVLAEKICVALSLTEKYTHSLIHIYTLTRSVRLPTFLVYLIDFIDIIEFRIFIE